MTSAESLRRQATITFSARNRRRKLDFALDFASCHSVRSVLVVGVSGGWNPEAAQAGRVDQRAENMIEQGMIAAGLTVTASGLEPEAVGWDRYVQADALDLPFRSGEFDLVYSNAVIEHVGREPEQGQFVAEHARVGGHWILTTPNRWFPIESHSDVLFKHWRDEWAETSCHVSRLLGPADLRALLPSQARLHGHLLSPTLTASSA